MRNMNGSSSRISKTLFSVLNLGHHSHLHYCPCRMKSSHWQSFFFFLDTMPCDRNDPIITILTPQPTFVMYITICWPCSLLLHLWFDNSRWFDWFLVTLMGPGERLSNLWQPKVWWVDMLLSWFWDECFIIIGLQDKAKALPRIAVNNQAHKQHTGGQ